jgi:hypothetical protein
MSSLPRCLGIGMKMEWKLSDFSVKNENMEIKMEFCKTEFFGGSGNGTAFSDGTDTEMEFPFPTDTEFPFYSDFT